MKAGAVEVSPGGTTEWYQKPSRERGLFYCGAMVGEKFMPSQPVKAGAVEVSPGGTTEWYQKPSRERGLFIDGHFNDGQKVWGALYFLITTEC
ncbi:hypothetical protein [Allomuricauda sp. SCSIO 65647]|uniref:hypothetical protein n=1 Tax=Allomuricauda sp. SCSIO 65647 TaxID=2908843 RepID=UPI001F4188C9|nr:hypothetical protein [Muricauda sp. SCSIO 65647]UJH69108.1 hypothetical protein L0P89_07815 [Muricauda sp. SCSIO 65647]